MLKILRTILITAAVLLILISVTINMAPRLGLVIGEIGSGSMEPTLEIGAMVIAQRIAPEQLKVGDIIVFRLAATASNNVCHRIASIIANSPPSFITKGDNSPQADALALPAQNVVGRVTFHMPLAGYFVQFLKSAPGLGLGLLLPALWIIAICWLALRREIISFKKKDDNRVVIIAH